MINFKYTLGQGYYQVNLLMYNLSWELLGWKPCRYISSCLKFFKSYRDLKCFSICDKRQCFFCLHFLFSQNQDGKKKYLFFSPGYLHRRTNRYHSSSAGLSLHLCIQVFHCCFISTTTLALQQKNRQRNRLSVTPYIPFTSWAIP